MSRPITWDTEPINGETPLSRIKANLGSSVTRILTYWGYVTLWPQLFKCLLCKHNDSTGAKTIYIWLYILNNAIYLCLTGLGFSNINLTTVISQGASDSKAAVYTHLSLWIISYFSLTRSHKTSQFDKTTFSVKDLFPAHYRGCLCLARSISLTNKSLCGKSCQL